MKTKYTYLLLLLLFSSYVFTQCPEQNLGIKSQTELNKFKILYPDCTDLEVNLYLSSFSIVDLSPLDGLKNMKHLGIYDCSSLFIADINDEIQISSLYISQCPILESARIINNVAPNGNLSLSQLPKLSLNETHSIEILNDLEITELKITSFNKFPELTTINGLLSLTNNANLSDISMLNDVQLNAVDINSNPNLESCVLDVFCDLIKDDIEAISIHNNGNNCLFLQQIIEVCHPDTTICYLKELKVNKQSDLDYFINFPDQCIDSISIVNISAYEDNDITDLSNLIRFKELHILFIEGANQLTSLKGLDSLQTTFYLGLYGNDNLETIEGLNNLKEITALFEISFNPKLSSLSDDHLSLDKLGALHINGTINDLTAVSNVDSLTSLKLRNTQVKNFDWAENIHFGTEFIVSQNENLESIKLKDSAHGIRTCRISDNINLTEIEGLEFKDTTIEIHIENNPILTLKNIKGPKICVGSINIYNTMLKNLEPWQGLQQSNYVWIGHNPQLETTEFLSSFKEIGTLSIIANTKLASLGSLSNEIQSINKLDLSWNDALQDISALDNEGRINDVNIINNPLLELCDILPICKEYKTIYPNIVLSGNGGNCNLVDLNFDCEWGQNAYGDVIVKSQYDLDSISSLFPLMDSVNGNLILDFSANSDDIDFSYFEKIEFVRDGLEIHHPKDDGVFEIFEGITVSGLLLTNLETPTLDILDYTDELTQFRLTNVSGISDFSGLENVTNIKEKIDIVGSSIISTDGLDNLQSIDAIQFVDCPQLTNINSLSNVEYIDKITLSSLPEFSDFALFDGMDLPSELQFNNLPQLTDVPSFVQNLYTDIFRISECNALTKLQIDSIYTINTLLSIFDNDILESISFKKLGRANYFSINNNSLINDIKMPILNTVESTFYIAFNDVLPDLAGVSSNLLAPTIYIIENPNLADCNMPLICNNFEAGSDLTVEYNLGCQTLEEITDNCTVSSEDLLYQNTIKVFPNPVSNILYLEGSYEPQSVILYNSIGQKVDIEIISNQIDVKTLVNGVYYLRVADGDDFTVVGFVKE